MSRVAVIMVCVILVLVLMASLSIVGNIAVSGQCKKLGFPAGYMDDDGMFCYQRILGTDYVRTVEMVWKWPSRPYLLSRSEQ